jgi:hypothetical protein
MWFKYGITMDTTVTGGFPADSGLSLSAAVLKFGVAWAMVANWPKQMLKVYILPNACKLVMSKSA